MIALFPLLVGALALADRGPALVLARPWAVYGGRLSYALYLVHIPMFEVYWTALQHERALGPHTLLAHLTGLGVLVATLVVAAVAYRGSRSPPGGGCSRSAGPDGTSCPPGCGCRRIDGVRRTPRHALVIPAHRAA